MQILRSTFLFVFLLFFLQSENEDEKFSSARFTFFLSFSSSPFFLRWHIEINVNFFHTLAPYWFPKYPRARGGGEVGSPKSLNVLLLIAMMGLGLLRVYLIMKYQRHFV